MLWSFLSARIWRYFEGRKAAGAGACTQSFVFFSVKVYSQWSFTAILLICLHTAGFSYGTISTWFCRVMALFQAQNYVFLRVEGSCHFVHLSWHKKNLFLILVSVIISKYYTCFIDFLLIYLCLLLLVFL